jgi:hypothetical protein
LHQYWFGVWHVYLTVPFKIKDPMDANSMSKWKAIHCITTPAGVCQHSKGLTFGLWIFALYIPIAVSHSGRISFICTRGR